VTPGGGYWVVGTNEQSDVMILRAWVEPGHSHPLRVRIMRTGAGEATPPAASMAATVDDACRAVRSWLEEYLAGENPCPPP
jgi:hypothetical protein